MKPIRKFIGPMPDLDDYRKRAGENASYQGYKGNKVRYRKLIRTLTDLQHGLCGYCEIGLRDGDRQVEHVVPQSHPKDGAHRALDATNLIACCRGGSSDEASIRDDDERSPGRSCGLAKGNNADPDFLDPRTLPDLPSLTRVRPDGWIEADEKACRTAGCLVSRVDKTVEILGLNVRRLQRARERIWRDLEDLYREFHDDRPMVEALARRQLLPDHNGRLRKFFTTSRSYFKELGERILEEEPRNWI